MRRHVPKANRHQPHRHKGRQREAEGEKGYKTIEFKVFVGDRVFPIVHRAPAGQCYIQRIIDTELERTIEHIDKSFPKLEFNMVQLAPNKFNFVCVGMRKIDENKTTETDGQAAAAPDSVLPTTEQASDVIDGTDREGSMSQGGPPHREAPDGNGKDPDVR